MADGFNSKNWVWVPDGTFYTEGYITETLSDGTCKVTLSNEAQKIVDQKVVEKCNPTKFNKCNDMAELTHLNEPSVVYNLYLRYNDDLIYTYSGLFLVAINPYKTLQIYDIKELRKYHTQQFEKPPPHIFATAEGTYRNMLVHKKNQSILVTGESGAGKTENTKKIIQYLSSITGTEDKNTHHGIDAKILQANPILESFGNAKTIKNNNSSRFGKFIRIFFSTRGHITGANIDYYLLEKSRVVGQAAEERNYHVFYQFLKGYDKLGELGLEGDITKYCYLSSKSNTFDDAKEFGLLVDAFNVVGFQPDEMKSIFEILAVVLHLGNLEFTSQKAEQASFTKDSPVKNIANLLGIDSGKFVDSLVRPKVKAGREYVQRSMKAPEVKHAVDAFAKYLYERLFQYLIERINVNLAAEGSFDDDSFIGVLDIAGFEIFDINSFEQLCINYTNEKLQQFFNHHSFILEQSEYLRENIEWEFIDFGQDLQPTIDLIESNKPMGILKLLHEECVIPKATDRSFMEKLSANFAGGKSAKFEENKFKSGFIIHHYAGKVEYNVDNWLQKNTDPVSEHVLNLLPSSSKPFICNLFDKEEVTSSPTKRPQRLKSASLKHKEQLSRLMEQLGSTEPHFVRCILPNLDKKPNKFDKALVSHQLRCNGVLEGIRITRAGYPNRMTFEDFNARYSIINVKEVLAKNPKTNSELLLKHIELDKDSFKIGITKIFFKNGILGKLEEMRESVLKNIFTDLQSVIRGKASRVLMKRKIKEIQSSQLFARTIKAVDESLTSSLWMDLFVNIKPLLEESVKVLDNKKMSENLKNVSLKLKDAEKSKVNLEADNTRLRESIINLEDQMKKTSGEISLRQDELRKLADEKKAALVTVASLEKKVDKLGSLSEELTVKLRDAEATIGEERKKLEKKEREYQELKKNYEGAKQRVVQVEGELEKSKGVCKSLKEKIDQLENEKSKLTTLNSSLEGELQKHKPRVETLSREVAELKSSVASHVANAAAKDRELNSLRSNHKRHEESSTDLEKKLAEAQIKLRDISSNMDKKSKEVAEAKSIAARSTAESEELRKQLANLKALEADITTSKRREKKNVEEITSLSNALSAANTEKKALGESLAKLKREYESMKRENRQEIDRLSREAEKLEKELSSHNERLDRVKREHSGQMDSLKREQDKKMKELEKRSSEAQQVQADLENKLEEKKKEHAKRIEEMSKELSLLRKKESEKENHDPTFVEDFASIKLKLNEQNAALRKEKFENKKIQEELSILKDRMASGTSLRSTSEARRTSQTMPAFLNAEVENLRKKIQIEEANAQRAENYAIELQKKLNKVQSTRGINSYTDYEKKYREAQKRIAELEARFEEFFMNDSGMKSMSSSESFNRNSVIQKTLANANNDFVVIYQDISRTLRTTRDELGVAKSEILRLKSLLRESEDELYDAKRQTFRTSISDYEEELASVKVRYDALVSKNDDLTSSLDIFKRRAEEYYNKLELAESAVTLSKKSEEAAQKQLEEARNNLRMAREEARSSQILVKELRKKGSQLEDTISDKSFQIQKLNTQIRDLNDKTRYYTTNYDNREVNEGLKKEIRELHLDLNEKMKNETALVRENKKLQLDLEDVTREKKVLQEEYESKVLREEELEIQVEELSAKSTKLENDLMAAERKVLSLTKQVESLKEVMAEITANRDSLLEKNGTLESELFKLTSKFDDLSVQYNKSQADLALMRDHLAQQREESSSIKSEFNKSKISSSSEMQDYQKMRRSILVTEEENDSLKRVNKELTQKVHVLEEKLYSDEQLKYWENKVQALESELDYAHADNHQHTKEIKNLQSKVHDLTLQVESESKLSKKFNDENFDYQNKFTLLQASVEKYEREAEGSRVRMGVLERECTDLKQENMLMEKEILELRGRLGLGN